MPPGAKKANSSERGDCRQENERAVATGLSFQRIVAQFLFSTNRLAQYTLAYSPYSSPRANRPTGGELD